MVNIDDLLNVMGDGNSKDFEEKLDKYMDELKENELMDKTLEFADKLAAGPTIQFALTKQAVLKSLTREPWDSAALESWGQDKARETMDFKEGIKAFKERRQPEFKGK